jgi:thioredoxin 1
MTVEEILASKKPIMVDVYSNDCGPCRKMMPLIHELQAEGHNVITMDAYSETDFCLKYGIDTIPQFLVFKDGEMKTKLTGIQTKENLLKALISAYEGSE